MTEPPPPHRPLGLGRAVALGIAALGLLSLVALASQGPLLRARSHGNRGGLPPGSADLFAIAGVVGAGLFVYGVILARRQRRPGEAAGNWRMLAIVAAVVVIGLWLHRHDQQKPLAPAPAAVTVAPRAGTAAATPPRPSHPQAGSHFTWLEVIALAAASLIAVAAAARPRRRGTGWTGRTADEAFAALVDDSLEDLRAEPDPRRAVIAAYARMERGLGASGLVRTPAETSLEYLGRVLADRRVSPAAASRLTALFERAKFSDHAVAEEAKQDAIAALVAIRDELRTRGAMGDPTVAGRP